MKNSRDKHNEIAYNMKLNYRKYNFNISKQNFFALDGFSFSTKAGVYI